MAVWKGYAVRASTAASTKMPLPAYQVEKLALSGNEITPEKRGGPQERLSLTAVERWNTVERNEDILALDEALTKLEKADPRAARVVELRFFGGLEEAEVAEVLGVSIITVRRDWKVARAWLIGRLKAGA
jgi:RNA polymerase sigma factor (TIGR02999 family)